MSAEHACCTRLHNAGGILELYQTCGVIAKSCGDEALVLLTGASAGIQPLCGGGVCAKRVPHGAAQQRGLLIVFFFSGGVPVAADGQHGRQGRLQPRWAICRCKSQTPHNLQVPNCSMRSKFLQSCGQSMTQCCKRVQCSSAMPSQYLILKCFFDHLSKDVPASTMPLNFKV